MAGLTPVLGAWLQRGEFFGVRGQLSTLPAPRREADLFTETRAVP